MNIRRKMFRAEDGETIFTLFEEDLYFRVSEHYAWCLNTTWAVFVTVNQAGRSYPSPHLCCLSYFKEFFFFSVGVTVLLLLFFSRYLVLAVIFRKVDLRLPLLCYVNKNVLIDPKAPTPLILQPAASHGKQILANSYLYLIPILGLHLHKFNVILWSCILNLLYWCWLRIYLTSILLANA